MAAAPVVEEAAAVAVAAAVVEVAMGAVAATFLCTRSAQPRQRA